MLSIRLSRVGRKNAPSYRVVVMPKHRDPYAKVTEIVGHYNPRKDPRELDLKADRIKHWISKGAQATDTVWNLLVEEKIVQGEKRGVTHLSKKRRAKIEEKENAKKEADEKVKAEAEKPVESGEGPSDGSEAGSGSAGEASAEKEETKEEEKPAE